MSVVRSRSGSWSGQHAGTGFSVPSMAAALPAMRWIVGLAAALGIAVAIGAIPSVVVAQEGRGAPTGDTPLPFQEGFARELMGAEASFRRGEDQAALERFETLVVMDPWSARAWLRIGNLHHRAGKHEQARTAYRHATVGSPADPLDEEARRKAYVNLALLGVQQANDALRALEETGASRMQPTREQVRSDLSALQRRLAELPILRDLWAATPSPAPAAR
jgi:tetratricopeptide (TPR) repeat protein